MLPVAKLKSLDALEKLRKSIVASRDPDKLCISVCSGTGCRAYGCEQVTAEFEQELKKQGLVEKVDLRATGCHGFCEKGPVIVIRPSRIFYPRVKVADVPEIVSETIVKSKVVERLLFTV